MNNRKVNKSFKRNKYRLAIVAIFFLLGFFIINLIINHNRESQIAKYDNEILIVKGNGDQLDSLTLKEIRHLSPVKKDVYLSNGLEKVSIEGVAIERIIGKLNYNLKDRSTIVVEDNEGNMRRLHMSQALEPDRIYLVYKINDTPIFDLAENYGKLALIDSTSDSSSSWFTNVKTLDIQ